MKRTIILYVPSKDGYAHEKLFASRSALDRSHDWAKSIDNTTSIELLYADHVKKDGKTNLSLLLSALQSILTKQQSSYAIFAWADCPFLNKDLTAKLIEYHENYRAEYTFAEGFPQGLAPELISTETIALLQELITTKSAFLDAPVERESLFNLIKTDINSFEIETYLADGDWRYLRLQFFCNNKRNALACERLFDFAEDELEDAHALSRIAETSSSVQRTLPAFYPIQIYAPNEDLSTYEPSRGHFSMDKNKFAKLIKNIEAFSDDGVISLSLLGDPLYHPDFLDFARVVLESNLNLLIETDGLKLNDELIVELSRLCSENPVLENGQRKLNFIIRLDATDEAMYKTIHNHSFVQELESPYTHAVEMVHKLKKAFPHAVYPQFVRMNCNEEQLENFFRTWTADATGELIVQKHDYLSGLLPDVRPADLSPAKRYACWHIKRDMTILADGTCVRCKAASYAQDTKNSILGNVFEENLATVWARGDSKLVKQLDGHYDGQCGDSDEWYTFNF